MYHTVGSIKNGRQCTDGGRVGGTRFKKERNGFLLRHIPFIFPNFGCIFRIQHLVYHTSGSSSAYNRVSDRRACDSCCACVRNDFCKWCHNQYTHKLMGLMEMSDIYTNPFYNRGEVLRTREQCILRTHKVVVVSWTSHSDSRYRG